MAAWLTIGRGLISIKAHYDLGSSAFGLSHQLALRGTDKKEGGKVFLLLWPGIPLKSLHLGEFGFAGEYQIVSAIAAKSN